MQAMMMQVLYNHHLILLIILLVSGLGQAPWHVLTNAVVFSRQLQGKVACVTGASRGIGRGIAIALAEQGATVYITGRSSSTSSTTEKALGGSLQEVVEEIANKGGLAIPVNVDHRQDQQVQQLFQQISQDYGRLDILVNNAFQLPSASPEDSSKEDLLFQKFWQLPLSAWDSMMQVGLRSHYVASHYAFPLMKETTMKTSEGKHPLIVHISSFGGTVYSFNVPYGVGKGGVDRLAKDMHVELASEGIKCISLYPGIVRTERMAKLLDSGEYERRTQFAVPSQFVESPELSGEVIATLYSNAGDYLSKQSGKVCVTAELAKRYQIVDRNSKIIPPSIRSLKFLIPALFFRNKSANFRKQLEPLVIGASPDILLPFSVMAGGAPK